MNIEEARKDLSERTKKGMSFILASIILWAGISVIWLLPIENVLRRNLYTFCFAAPLMPLAYIISKIIKTEFSSKDNPLNNLGLLFSANQFMYILIAMWAFSNASYSMVMIIAIIFGAHLLPFSWLYNSKAYLFMSIIISLSSLVIGTTTGNDRVYLVPLFMTLAQTIFSIWLFIETRGFEYSK